MLFAVYVTHEKHPGAEWPCTLVAFGGVMCGKCGDAFLPLELHVGVKCCACGATVSKIDQRGVAGAHAI